jgi:hypothetical protein
MAFATLYLLKFGQQAARPYAAICASRPSPAQTHADAL